MNCADSGAHNHMLQKNQESGAAKPCIDFQPNDRWQIESNNDKKVDDPSKSEMSDSKVSNGTSTKTRNAKSKPMPVNGEASSSDEDPTADADRTLHTNEDKTEKENGQLCTKRSSSDADLVELDVKKAKTGDSASNDSAGEDIQNSDEDADKEREISNISSSSSSDDKDENEENDLDSSIEIIEEDDSKAASVDSVECEEISSEEKETSVGEAPSEITQTQVQKKDEIEVINIPDDKSDNSDDDSEVQIIATEDFVTKSDIPSTSSKNKDITMTAGYPYYNSLVEKIDSFRAGNYKPVKFPHTGTLLLAENEVIVESPSLLVPLLIKERDKFPKSELESKKSSGDGIVLPRSGLMSKKNFFQSSVGQFLINLGSSRVQEWYYRDMKHIKQKQLKYKKANEKEIRQQIELHDKKYNQLKEINAIFNIRLRKCKFCEFKSESLSVMEGHYLTPHLSSRREYQCSFCSYLCRDTAGMSFHYEAFHKRKAVFEANTMFHECTFCSFHSTMRTKVNAHLTRCRKHFIPSQNLAPPFDFEFPGVTTKPVTIADVIGHKRMIMNPKARVAVPEDSAFARKKLQSVLTRLSAPNSTSNPNLMKQLMGSTPRLAVSTGSGIQLPPGIVVTKPGRPQIAQVRQPTRIQLQGARPPVGMRGPMPRVRVPYGNIASTASQLASSGISITPVTRGSMPAQVNNSLKNVTLTPIATSSNKIGSAKPGGSITVFTNVAGNVGTGMIGAPQPKFPVNMNLRPVRPTIPYRLTTPPSQVVKGSSGNTFVVCEICDSFIRDLEELRTHMNWVHKVKIHPKMLSSRPPLNCQKCQWRFFTDQGLERHLLGAHGLVTTNMQEMANKNQDGGRCIICGAVFTYKLVSHMTQVHKVTLKPAHLSYKCTVCTATFTLYRLFESHVYNVHSGSSKRTAEDSAESTPSKKAAVAPEAPKGPRRCKECGLVTENLHNHLKEKHMKPCSVRLCHVEKCKKCLYKHDEFIVIRMSDFGLEEEDSDSSSSEESSGDSSEGEDKE